VYTKTDDELWLCKWQSPFVRTISINNPPAFFTQLYQPVNEVEQVKLFIVQILLFMVCISSFYVDLLDTGFFGLDKDYQMLSCEPDRLSAMGLSGKTVLASYAQLHQRRIFCSAHNIVEPRVQQGVWFTTSSCKECDFYDYSRSLSFHFSIHELIVNPVLQPSCLTANTCI
jgi:hypothetical protein